MKNNKHYNKYYADYFNVSQQFINSNFYQIGLTYFIGLLFFSYDIIILYNIIQGVIL